MNIAKQVDRARYILATPRHFLQLLNATAPNLWHAATASWSPRRVCCNLCGWEGRRFDYYLERYFVVPNEQCPRCFSHERNRELVNFIARSHDLSGLRIMEIAPTRFYKEWFEERDALYNSIDLGNRPADVHMDATQLGFPSASMNLVICSHVLEHIPDYQSALREIHRILKIDGIAYIDVPFSREHETYPIEPPGRQGHVYEFGIDIVEKIRESGFEVTLQAYNVCKKPNTSPNEFFLAQKGN